MDPRGRVTSHLVGLFFRTTRLVSEFGLQLVFVFDGPQPPLKSAEIEKRRRIRERYEAETAEARAAGDLARAYSKATMTSRLTREMAAEARELLRLLGIPTIEAPVNGPECFPGSSDVASPWQEVLLLHLATRVVDDDTHV